MFYFWFFVANTVLCLAVGYVAEQKGRKYSTYFWLAFCLSFLVGILVVLALPPLEKKPIAINEDIQIFDGERLIKCPFCAEWVKQEAKVCKHCGRDIHEQVQALLAKEIMWLADQESLRRETELAARRRAVSDRQALLKAEAEKLEKRRAFRKSGRFKVIVASATLAILAILATTVSTVITIDSFKSAERSRIDSEPSFEKIQQARAITQLDWTKPLAKCATKHDGITVSKVRKGYLELSLLRSDDSDLYNQQHQDAGTNQESESQQWLDCVDKTVLEPGLKCPNTISVRVYTCPLSSILASLSYYLEPQYSDALSCDYMLSCKYISIENPHDGGTWTWTPGSDDCVDTCTRFGSWSAPSEPGFSSLPYNAGLGLTYQYTLDSPSAKSWSFRVIAKQGAYSLTNCNDVFKSEQYREELAGLVKNVNWGNNPVHMTGWFGPYKKGRDIQYSWFNDTNMDGVVCDGKDPMTVN